MPLNRSRRFNEMFLDQSFLDDKCIMRSDNWRPIPSEKELRKWRKWQQKGTLRVKKEFALTHAAWRNVARQRRRYIVESPRHSTVEEISTFGESDGYELDIGLDEVLIADITDTNDREGLPEEISETLLQLFEVFMPEEIEGEYEYEEVGEEGLLRTYRSHGRTKSPKLTFNAIEETFVPVVELVKDDFYYPETLESKRRYKQKYINEAEYEKRKMIEAIKKRIEDLTALREELRAQDGLYKCHMKERLEKEELRKRKFLKKLAKEKSMNLATLTRIGDRLYKTHKENLRKIRNAHIEYLDKEIKYMNILIRERCKEIKFYRNLPDDLKKPSKSELTVIDDTSLSSPNKRPSLAEEEMKRGRATKLVVPKKKMKKLKLKTDEEQAEDSDKDQQEAEEEHSPEKIKEEEEKAEEQPEEQPQIPESQLSLQPPPEPELFSKFDPEILSSLKIMEELLHDIEDGTNRWYMVEEQFPVEHSISTVPKSILFESFIPYNVYKKKFTIINETIRKIQFKVIGINTFPGTCDKELIKVEPMDDCHLLPGIPKVKEVIFSPLIDTPNMDAEVMFYTRRDQSDIRMFKLLIKCTQQRAVPVLSATLIKFPTQKIWATKVLTKVLTITNIGGLPFVGHISSGEVEESNGSDSFESLPTLSLSGSDKSVADVSSTRGSMSSKGTRKKKNKNRRKTLRMKMLLNMARLLLDDAMFEALDCIRILPKYHLPVAPGKQVKIEIQFSPNMVPFPGCLRRNYTLNFEGINVENSEQMLTVEVKTEEGPFQVDTTILDMKTCVTGGVFQIPFQVKNNGYLTYQMLVKIPRQVTNHMCVIPSSPIVKPGSNTSILVKLAPKWTFPVDLGKYFDPENCVFDIPIRVTSKNEEDTGAPIVVHAMGSLSRCMGVRIAPKNFNLGVVTTAETVIINIYLFNYSPGTCYYGFINIPKYIIIQPNYGFGMINGRESVKLHVLYSPTTELLERPGQTVKHEFSLCCTTVDRLACEPPNVIIRFDDEEQGNQLCAVTDVQLNMERFESTAVLNQNVHSVKRRRRMLHDGTKLQKNLFTLHFPDLLPYTSGGSNYSSASDSAAKSNKKKRKTSGPIGRIESKTDVPLDESQDLAQLVEPLTDWEVPEPLYDSVTMTALIIDPLSELSAQKVIMPPTPYYSYSIASIYIRAPNTATLGGCYCGKIKPLQDYPTSNVIIRFEFFSNRIQLEIQPCKGKFKMNESVKIFFILRPFLHPPDVDSNARRLKAELIKKELLEQWKQAKLKKEQKEREAQEKKESKKKDSEKKEKKKGKEKKKDKKGKAKKIASVISTKVPRFSSKTGVPKNGKVEKESPKSEEPPEFVVDLKKLTIDKNDILAAKIDMLKSLDPTGFESRVTCLVETCMVEEPFTVRNEILHCNVICPIIIPNMIVSTAEDGPVLNFGSVVLGTKVRKWVQVHNTCGRTIFVTRTILDTNGLFYCPFTISHLDALRGYRGIMVEPDHTLELPIFFCPKNDNTEVRYFELMSDNTVVQLKVSGRGTPARYSIKPQFLYAHLRAPFEDKQELNIVIENDCDAPLPFSFRHLGSRAGYELPPPEPVEQSKEQDKEKGEGKDKEKGGKKEKKKGSDKKNKKAKDKKTDTKKDKKDKTKQNKQVEQSMEISENLLRSIETNFEEIPGPEPLFIIPETITVQPKSKEKFTIDFIAPPIPKVEELEGMLVHKSIPETQKGSKKKKARVDIKHEIATALEQLEKKIYMTEIRVYLGDVIHILDWTIFGHAEKGGARKSKRSGTKQAESEKKKKTKKKKK